MVQTISLLGSTGSIGRQTLDVCREQGIRVAALTARNSLDLLEEQARAFRPRLVAVTDLEPALELARRGGWRGWTSRWPTGWTACGGRHRCRRARRW